MEKLCRLIYSRALSCATMALAGCHTVRAQPQSWRLEVIVSKHRDHPYRSVRSKTGLKIKNPAAPGVLRFGRDVGRCGPMRVRITQARR
jgi:ATP-dependent DNA ligase